MLLNGHLFLITAAFALSYLPYDFAVLNVLNGALPSYQSDICRCICQAELTFTGNQSYLLLLISTIRFSDISDY